MGSLDFQSSALSYKPSVTLGTLEQAYLLIAGGVELKNIGNGMTKTFLHLSWAFPAIWASMVPLSHCLKRDGAHLVKRAPL